MNTTILDFIHSILGTSSSPYDFIFYILGGVLLLIFIDGLLSFIFGSISSMFKG